MIRKAVIVVLTLASIAVAVLWVGSYRVRQPKPLTPEEKAALEGALISPGPPDPLDFTGLRAFHESDDRSSIVMVRACVGQVSVRFDSRIETGTPVARLDRRGLGFRYTQSLWLAWVIGTQRGEYRSREVTVPLWFPFILLAAYPTVAFIRGPARRWWRRRKGCCLNCDYDLTGNVSGVCPECGRTI
jgi:hypothetical protein